MERRNTSLNGPFPDGAPEAWASKTQIEHACPRPSNRFLSQRPGVVFSVYMPIFLIIKRHISSAQCHYPHLKL